MFENITKQDVDGIIKLWEYNFDKKYHIDRNRFIKNVFDDVDFYSDGSFILKIDNNVVGLIIVKLNNRNIEEYENCAWLNILLVDKKFRCHGYGTSLYKLSEKKLINLGIKKILLGGDINNFFSGIPEPSHEVERFFKDLGFQLNEPHYDLMADVSKLDFSKLNVKINMDSSYIVKEFRLNDINVLNEFFDKNFPGRWKHEINNYIENNGDFRNIILMWCDKSVIGFCKINVDATGNGSLGPIGIDIDYRGKKLGNKLLLESLNLLKMRGTRNVVIDWTILKEFYGQFGFRPYKFYRSGFKELGDNK
ncbi:GNAT family N-acetyltransferase [Thermoanaerobacterium thermosaccharolyticum]|uniref:GNAT family N-acetyltransferase n=1 Tax=Thermoanaerobacterium thermosaccharolyticum TaxID=1517 RepID=UPI00123C79F7|nr:GNAT family N-acetyltransferase [Thermoanaerobacterium thermosaccharolyticum]KAA5807919.1 GNAT family N-acetyltransferase [Thermoanaerobacterium thermosaccharolyticum]